MDVINGITVSVGYGDILAVTLPRNAKHFEHVIVVTDSKDKETRDVIAKVPNAVPYITDSFYLDGATFNKGRALEEGLQCIDCEGLGHGWILVHDADILMPDVMPLESCVPGNLYNPPRRMLYDPTQWREDLDWKTLDLAGDVNEFPGYFQLFHTSDPVLRSRPWYAVDWKHAGGCDSAFQKKWSADKKFRPDFEVLHLGEDGKNWCGRATKRMDGTMPAGASENAAALRKFIQRRKRGTGPSRYNHEKLP